MCDLPGVGDKIDLGTTNEKKGGGVKKKTKEGVFKGQKWLSVTHK